MAPKTAGDWKHSHSGTVMTGDYGLSFKMDMIFIKLQTNALFVNRCGSEVGRNKGAAGSSEQKSLASTIW